MIKISIECAKSAKGYLENEAIDLADTVKHYSELEGVDPEYIEKIRLQALRIGKYAKELRRAIETCNTRSE